jgi:hypothetical protein
VSGDDRGLAVAVETVVATVMIGGGVLATRLGGFLGIFGVVLALMGFLALLHAVALGLGVIHLPRGGDDENADDGSRKQ